MSSSYLNTSTYLSDIAGLAGQDYMHKVTIICMRLYADYMHAVTKLLALI